jgi:hypothetical protein
MKMKEKKLHVGRVCVCGGGGFFMCSPFLEI